MSFGGLPSSCHVKCARHLDGKLQYKALAEMNKVQYPFFFTFPFFLLCLAFEEISKTTSKAPKLFKVE